MIPPFSGILLDHHSYFQQGFYLKPPLEEKKKLQMRQILGGEKMNVKELHQYPALAMTKLKTVAKNNSVTWPGLRAV